MYHMYDRESEQERSANKQKKVKSYNEKYSAFLLCFLRLLRLFYKQIMENIEFNFCNFFALSLSLSLCDRYMNVANNFY